MAQLSAAVKPDKGRQKTWGLVCDEPCAALTLLQLCLTKWECCKQSNRAENVGFYLDFSVNPGHI